MRDEEITDEEVKMLIDVAIYCTTVFVVVMTFLLLIGHCSESNTPDDKTKIEFKKEK